MILDKEAITQLVQAAADSSNQPQTLYQRKNGSYIFCAKGNEPMLKMALNPNEQVGYIETINPSGWPKKEVQ